MAIMAQHGGRTCAPALLLFAVLVLLPLSPAAAQQTVSFRDTAVAAYSRRVNMTLDWAAEYVVRWANNKASLPANTYRESMWLVGGALTRAGNATVREAALKMTASLLVQTLTPGQYLTGGNMGWPAWAFAAVYAQFQDIFDADTVLYNLTYPLDPAIIGNLTSPQTIRGMMRAALKFGIYNPWDSTSNHLAMNAVARFL